MYVGRQTYATVVEEKLTPERARSQLYSSICKKKVGVALRLP